jgi:hypothetical protein
METGSERLEGTTLDLSLGGALVQSNRVFPSGALVTVSLELEAGTPPMRSGARVIRTVGTDCIGIQFVSLGPKESIRLQQFLLPLILAAISALCIDPGRNTVKRNRHGRGPRVRVPSAWEAGRSFIIHLRALSRFRSKIDEP